MKRLQVTSRQNPTIKLLHKLSKASAARSGGLFICEGARLISRALDSGYSPQLVCCCENMLAESDRQLMRRLAQFDVDQWLDVPKFLLDYLSYRDGGDGLLVVFERQELSLAGLPVKPGGLYMVLESPEKPGNIGAVARSVDAAGADGLIVCDERTDIYNPNCQTASTGSIFSLAVAVATIEELAVWLAENSVRLLAAVCDEKSLDYRSCSYAGTTAIAIGREHEGLGSDMVSLAESGIYIPMMGLADSLNASAAAAVLLFNAVASRQS